MAMGYQVLARKWRPHDFSTMVGQEHILRMLSNALTQQRLHHAYLLTGTRGVGKTTLARIIAKCLNCESGITATPCNTCFACTAIDQGKFLDLYEIDAASRTKVEDTLELLGNVVYPPTQGRYKIYLIDEVHMLSNHSFNALLKTLEEPPSHVKFLLATTDPKKLPITILSRCLQFHLKRINKEQIAQHLQHICTEENILTDAQGLDKIARAADGSMRDALSLLDQAIAYGQGTVYQTDVQAMLGSVAQEDLMPILTALAQRDGKTLVAAIQCFAEKAPDFLQAWEEMIVILHQIAMTQVLPDAIPVSDEITELAKQISAEDVQLYYQIALICRRDLALSPTPQLGFEMGMLRMLAFKMNAAPIQATPPLPKQEPVKQPIAHQVLKTVTPVIPEALEPTAKTQQDEPPEALINNLTWRNVLPKLELSGMAYALAANCTLGKVMPNKVELLLSASHHPMLNPKLKERLQDALTRFMKTPIHLDIQITDKSIPTPQRQEQAEQQQYLQEATQRALKDPQVQKLVEQYDATIEVSLLK